ncbi:MAG: DHA2 family efflux MFS transporter permease subunit [Inquilinus limosus]|uniref:DHA2 family efflux MFS transporter permease subunit n=1 Tax=Inquilinus limosus TaxID=171674 RepID=A0A952KDD7_9PROT|nr:DHA2 family efflux MFS transporter permease subunit [Inquilinus limosus]
MTDRPVDGPVPARPAPQNGRWLALTVLCLGVLMIVLDSTVVNVALPSIKADLGFNDSTLAWVVNGYLLTFGGFLLLGGRLGDLFGHRRLFLIGLAVFTLASLACGLSGSQGILVAARAIQGLGGAVVSAVALSLIMDLFTEPADRAKAMGVYGFVCAGGGSIGVLLGGLLTGALSWHWIFLINLPIGIAVFGLSLVLLSATRNETADRRLDIAGAITVTAALMLAVYAIVNGNEAGWTSARTLGLLGGAVVLLAAFVAIESRVAAPLMPLGLFRLRSLAVANVVSVLWAAGMFAWFFLSALYMQQVLGYDPMEVGLAFLPSNLIMAAFSLGLSARLVMRVGIRLPIVIGLLLAAAGLALFAWVPVDGSFTLHVLPGMLLLGLGCGMALNPMLLAAMSEVAPTESGLASGMVNTAFMMGGALGLAVLASLAAARTGGLLADGAAQPVALVGGYHAAFLAGACFAALGAVLAAALLRPPPAVTEPSREAESVAS